MIRIDIRTGGGKVVRTVPADRHFDPVLAGVDPKGYPILGHLDPYGDTILNGMQVKTLLKEIELVREDERIIVATFADTLVAMCHECLSRPHQFLWFIGD